MLISVSYNINEEKNEGYCFMCLSVYLYTLRVLRRIHLPQFEFFRVAVAVCILLKILLESVFLEIINSELILQGHISLRLVYTYSRTSIIRTSIIRISRLSGPFLKSQFCHEYLLVMIKIRSHILF